jgi:hypothetical protein
LENCHLNDASQIKYKTIAQSLKFKNPDLIWIQTNISNLSD